MKRNKKRAAAAPRPRSRASDAAVYISMLLVAGAVAVALFVQAGYPTPVAASVSVAALAFFILVHAMLTKWQKKAASRRAPARQQAPPPRMDEAQALSAQPIAPPFPRHDLPLNATPTQPPPLPPMAGTQQPPQPPPLSAPRTPPPPPPSSPPMHDPLSAVPGVPTQVQADSEQGPPPLGPAVSEGPQLSSLQPPQIPGQSSSQEAKKDYWSFAPGAPGSESPPPLPEIPEDDPSFELPPLSALPEPLPESPRQKDVEVIQGLIKKLADEVNASDQEKSGGQEQAAPSEAGDSSLEASLAALRTTASTMRNASPDDALSAEAAEPAIEEATIEAAAEPGSPSETPPALPDHRHSKAEALSEAVKSGRIDVLLEPILGLGDQRAQHYEVSLRLRDPDGEALEIGPEDGDLSGTGFLPLVDGARIARTINVAQRLGERGKSGSVFSAYSGESLTADGFLSDVSSALEDRPATAGHLVLTFSQNDVRGFESPEWIALADLSRLGFRFALADVSDLDMDFESLARSGFTFVKLEASVFLEGLHAPEGLLPAADVCRHFAGLGLTLVVQGIDNGTKLAKIFGFGVLLGQGQLFGAPRPVKADALASQQNAAA